jgi:nucleoside-diphosphate-sugar epimerase
MQVRDYLHIDDVAGALWAIAQKSLTGIINIGSGVPVTNRQVAIQIGDILGCPELVKFGDLPYRPGDPMFVCADNRRLVEQTGWQPGFGMEEGLANTVDWWKEKSIHHQEQG